MVDVPHLSCNLADHVRDLLPARPIQDTFQGALGPVLVASAMLGKLPVPEITILGSCLRVASVKSWQNNHGINSNTFQIKGSAEATQGNRLPGVAGFWCPVSTVGCTSISATQYQRLSDNEGKLLRLVQ